MEAKGHEEIAKIAGIPLLKELFKKARKDFSPSHAQAFYMGNWLRDLSQVIDPVATAGFAETADKVVTDFYNWLIKRTVPLEWDKSITDINNAFEQNKDNLLLFIKQLVKTRNQGRDSDLHRILRFLIKLKAFYKFCQPDKENEKKIPRKIFYNLFDDFYSQYFPHEHLDRPEDHKEGEKVFYADKIDSLTRDPDNEKDNYLNIYSYLKDDIFVVAGILADVDRNWASQFLTNDVLGDDYSTHYYLAQIGRALHGVEDFFAHSNFIEHASTLMSSKFMKENKIWTNTNMNKRLKRYKPQDKDDKNIRMSSDWPNLPNETNVSTGYFDTTDTAISLAHILEEVLFGDQNESAVKEFFKKLDTFLEEPKSFVISRFDPKLLDEPELTRFSELQPDTILWLTSEFEKDNFILRDTAFKKDLESFLRVMSNPYVVQTFRAYATGYEYFKQLKEIYEGPADYIYKKFGKWIFKKATFWTAHSLLDWKANSRIGSHSLMAKDTTDAFLYDHGLNCAKAVHWYIVNTMGRWADDTWVGWKKEDTKWVNWVQLCEFFLSHPFSGLVIEKQEKEFVVDTYHVVTDTKTMYDTLVSLGEQYKKSADFAETENHKYWEEIADVNFDIRNQFEKMGIIGLEQQKKVRKDLINKYLNVNKIGYPVRLKPNYALKNGVVVIIPYQKVKREIPVFQPNTDKWFIKIMEPTKVKKGTDERWRIFESEQKSQGKFLDSKYHKYRYYKSSGKNDLEPVKKLDKMIEKAKLVRDQLEKKYQPKKQARAMSGSY